MKVIINITGIALINMSWSTTGTFNGIAFLGSLLILVSYLMEIK